MTKKCTFLVELDQPKQWNLYNETQFLQKKKKAGKIDAVTSDNDKRNENE